MNFLNEFRSIAPDFCKHSEFLSRYAPVDDEVKERFMLKARKAKIIKSVPHMQEAFAKMIKHQIQSARINFVIENVPNYGTRVSDNLPDRITARSIHDTMREFGDVRDAVIFKNHAYVWFEDITDARSAHGMLNNMMIESNIITTTVV